MIVLALDTSTSWGRFSLVADGVLLADQPHNVTGSYADALLPILDGLLADGGRRRDEVDALAVCNGPGSFTGLRIGVATAKGLAYALDVPLYAMSTLEAMAGAMLAAHPGREWAVPAVDARRGGVFVAVYRRRGEWLEEVAAPGEETADGWWARILDTVAAPAEAVYAGSGSAVLLGEGAGLRPELEVVGAPRLRPWDSAHPATARALAWAVSRGLVAALRVHPFTLTPLYLRVSDAETHRGLDLTPIDPVGADESL